MNRMSDAPTRKGDIEALVRHGEVGDEAELDAEVAEQAGFDGRRQHGACESGHRLGEAAVLGNEQVIVGVFQVERVEEELHPWGVSDEIRLVSHTAKSAFQPHNPPRRLGGNVILIEKESRLPDMLPSNKM